MAIYFADPYATNQRARIERINKLVRQYLPKGTDLRFVQPKDLARIVDRINHRPVRKLGYRTPHEVFFDQTMQPPDIDSP